MDDIAIIGMSCRFPGEASSIEGLWEMVENGRCAYSDFPEDRINIDGFYHPDGHRQGSLPFKGAHFVRNDLAAFDAAFFSMTEADVRALDPQQRMLLETSFEAIESAGLRMEDLKGSDTSVYVGAFVRDYEQISLRDMDFQPRYASTGSGTAIMSNRMSYFYDLHGASMTVDTGCSGSMVAVHLACQNLQAGNSKMAIAAGAGLILTPNTMMPMTALNFLSKDGRCFTFDARANGYGRGEGVGLVILKKLSDALEDNDPIRAVIRSSHLSQDGRTAGITLPSMEAQVFNICKAYEKSGLDFSQTGYVECHGTGTQAGDLAELTAISQTLSKGRTAEKPLLVGSVKPNVGHLEGAAGVAGLIKGALVVEKGLIPPVANFEKGNPALKFKEWNVEVPTKLSPWPISGVRRVSVNCFGFGGTNAHAILDAGDPYRKAYRKKNRNKNTDIKHEASRLYFSRDQAPQLIVFSAPNQPSTERIIQSYLDNLPRMRTLDQEHLDNFAYTLACRRTKFAIKAFAVACSRAELYGFLYKMTTKDFVRSDPNPAFKVSFMFSGQGSQRPEMGRGLLKFPVFNKSLQDASRFLKDTLGSSYNLFQEMMLSSKRSHMSAPNISQPATTVLQVALVDLLVSFGIRPASVIGHSSGEIAAAYAGSFISREAAWTIAYHRGARASQLKKSSSKEGSMLFVSISEEGAKKYLQGLKETVDVGIACINSPQSVTLSGAAKDIASVMSHFQKLKIFCREVPTGVAYHSGQMREVEQGYLEDIQHLPPATRSDSSCHMYSSLKARQIFASELPPRYWSDNLISPVRFSAAMRALVEETKPDVVIELSPHATLKASFEDILSSIPRPPSVRYETAMLREADEHYTLLRMLGALWARGCVLDMEQIVSRNAGPNKLDVMTDLPLYPWDHAQRFWHESAVTRDYRFRKFGRRDLIGAPCPDSASQEPRWRGLLRVTENPWLKDHQVQNTIIYPAAGMISTVIEGTRQHVPEKAEVSGYEIANMKIERPMIIPESDYGLEMMLHMKRTSPDGSLTETSFDWAIYSRTLNSSWTRHAHGFVRAVSRSGDASRADDLESTASKVTSGPSTSIDTGHFYENLDLVGMNYGPTFRNIETLTKGHEAAVGTIRIPDTRSTMPHKYEFDHVIHPATLDSAIQLLFALEDRIMVPTSIDSVFVSSRRPQAQKFTGCATAVSEGLRGAQASIAITDGLWKDANLVLKGLRLTSLSSTVFLPSHRNLCTEMQWKPDYTTVSLSHYEELLDLMAHKYPQLSILQVGLHSGYTLHTIRLLQSPDGYAPRLARYSIFDSRYSYIPSAVKKEYKSTPIWNLLEVRDITVGPEATPKYHLILNTQPTGQVDGLDRFLHPDGILLTWDWEYALTAYESDSACSCGDKTCRISINSPDRVFDEPQPFLLRPVGDKFRADFHSLEVIILQPDSPSQETRKLLNNLSAQFAVIDLPTRAVRLQQFLSGRERSSKHSLVISLLDLSADYDIGNWSETEFNTFKQLVGVAKGMLWVTQGASGETSTPNKALIIGLARTLASEDPETALITLDLSATTDVSASATGKTIFRALKRSMLVSPAREPRETEYREIENKLHIPRLTPLKAMNELIEDDMRTAKKVHKYFRDGPSDEVKELVVYPPGEQDKNFDNTYFTARRDTTPLGPHEVEIRFSATSIQQNDCHTVMGLSSQKTVGVDVQGTIIRVGSKVKRMQIGQGVVAIVSDGAVKSLIRVDERFVQPIVGGLITCTPSTWIPPFYALMMRCHIAPGRRILIHRAATNTGQAAIQIARKLGAEVYVTVCDDDKSCGEQREALMETFGLGSNMEDCAVPGWDARFLQKTGGQKMDIVIEPGSIPCEGNVVKKTGTVVQILGDVEFGDVSVSRPHNHSIIRLNFLEMLREEPELVADQLKGVYHFVSRLSHDLKQVLDPRPYSLSSLKSAFEAVKERPNFGGVLGYADDNTIVQLPARLDVKSLGSCDLGYRTYVLAGGLGGLGRSIAQLLMDNGAKFLLFLSRSTRLSPEADLFIRASRSKDMVIKHIAIDICDQKVLREVASRELRTLPPIGGIIQAAAVLRDTMFDNMTFDDWQRAVRPKYQGTMNLVDAFEDPYWKPWFLFLSSSSGIIGNRGQANYAAGNVFMDALAGSGVIKGRAISLDIGPVLEVGMVADNAETLSRLRETGFYGIRRDDFLKIIERAIAGDVGSPGNMMPSQVILGVGTGGLIRQNKPRDPYWSRTAMYSYLNCIDMPPPDLRTIQTAATSTVKAILASSADLEEATLAVGKALKEELAFKLATIKAADVDLSRSLQSYGVDSILAVQIRIWALNDIGASISIFNILSESPMLDLCRDMVKQVRAGMHQSTTPPGSPPAHLK